MRDARFSAAVATAAVVGTNEQAPIGDDDGYSLPEDGDLTVSAAAGVLSNDNDPEGAPLSATLFSGPQNGRLTFNADGSFTYTPDPDFTGTDQFRYRPGDGTFLGAPATVTLTVAPVNDAPTIVGLNGVRLNQGENYTFSDHDSTGLLLRDPDTAAAPDAPAQLTASVSEGTVSLGQIQGLTFSVGNGTDDTTFTATGTLADLGAAINGLSYTPDADFSGTDLLQVTLDDLGNTGSGAALTAFHTIALAVVDAARIDPNPGDDSFALDEDSTLTVDAAGGLLANDTDPNGVPLSAGFVHRPR